MKKIISGILFIAILVLVGLILFKFIQKENRPISDVLPQNPLVYIHLTDTADNFNELVSTEVFKAIEQIDYQKLLESIGMTQDQNERFNAVISQLKDPRNGLIINKLFGKEFSIAIYSSDSTMASMEIKSMQVAAAIAEDVLSNIFIVTRVPKDIQVAEVISRAFPNFGKNITNGLQDYNGLKIHTLKDNQSGLKYSYALIQDLLIIGIGDSAPKQAWDVARKKVQPLSDDIKFKAAVKRKLDEAEFIGFLDMENIFEGIKGQAEQWMAFDSDKDPEAEDKVDDFFQRVKGFENAGVSAKLNQMLSVKLDLFYDINKLEQDVALLYHQCMADENATISFIPKDVLGYQWTGCFGLDYFWKEVKKGIEQQARIASSTKTADQAIEELEQKIGLKIEEDIIAAIGDEMGGFLSEIKTGGFFPIPKLLLFVQIKNKGKMDKLLNHLADKMPLMKMQEENYKGLTLTFLPFSIGSDIQPAYTFLGNYLLLSINKQILKDSIDTSKGEKPSITSNEAFKGVDFGLSGKNSSVVFINTASIMDSLSAVIKWAGKWADLKEEKTTALESGSRKRLEDIIQKLKSDQALLTLNTEKIGKLEGEISNMYVQGLDTRTKQQEADNLKDEIDYLQKEVDSGLDKKQELEVIVDGYKPQGLSKEKRELVLDELIFPLLKSLQAIKAFGSTTEFNDGVIETKTYIKLK